MEDVIGRPRSTKGLSLGDMEKYYSGFSSAVGSRDLFLQAGPESKEQSIAHTWEALVEGLMKVTLDPEDPFNQTRCLLLDFKAGHKSFTVACAHCLGSQTHVWPDVDTFRKGQQILHNKSKV